MSAELKNRVGRSLDRDKLFFDGVRRLSRLSTISLILGMLNQYTSSRRVNDVFGSFVHYTLLWTFHDILLIIFIIGSFVEIAELAYRQMN